MNIEIWMEGYAATGEHGTAQRIWTGEAKDFDDAVRKYNEKYFKEFPDGKFPAEPYTRNCFTSDEAFKNRRANWKIWGCALYNNEQDARKSFG